MIQPIDQNWSEFSKPIAEALALAASSLKSRAGLISELSDLDAFNAEMLRIHNLLTQIESHISVLETMGPMRLKTSGMAHVIIMQPSSR